MHRVAEPELVHQTGHRDVELHRIEVDSGCLVFQYAGRTGESGVEEQTLLYRCQREHVNDVVLFVQLIDLQLAQLCGRDIGRGQSAAAVADIRADSGECLEPQLTQPLHLGLSDRRGRPRPPGPQMRAGFVTKSTLHDSGIEIHRVHQRHRHRRRHAGRGQAVLVDPPQVVPEIGCPGTEAPEIVEPDDRLRRGQIHIAVQVAQQPIGQRIGKCAQLLLGALDDWPQFRSSTGNFLPGQTPYAQRHRVLGGEPADGTRQIDIVCQLFVTPMTLDADADRIHIRIQEFVPRQPESDQQDVLHASVKRSRDLTEQLAGGLGVERYRQRLGSGVGVQLGQHGR